MKNIKKIKSCQQEIKPTNKKISWGQLPRREREKLRSLLTPDQRRQIYDHRSREARLEKAKRDLQISYTNISFYEQIESDNAYSGKEKQEESKKEANKEESHLLIQSDTKSLSPHRINTLLSVCKIDSFNSFVSCPQEKNQQRSYDSYIYNNINITHRDNYTTKRIVISSELEPPVLYGKDPKMGYNVLKKENIRKFKIWKRMNKDTEAQPSYTQNSQKQEIDNSTTPLYKPYVHKPRPVEDKQKAFKTMSSNIESEDFKRFVSLVGLETARACFKKIYDNTTTEY